MGTEHFLMKGLHNVGTEMSLHVLCYNLKRVINILGVEGLLRALYALFVTVFFLPRQALYDDTRDDKLVGSLINRNPNSNSR
jgi:hypothetical protein